MFQDIYSFGSSAGFTCPSGYVVSVLPAFCRMLALHLLIINATFPVLVLRLQCCLTPIAAVARSLLTAMLAVCLFYEWYKSRNRQSSFV